MPRIDNSDVTSFTIPGVTFTPVAAPSRGTTETAIWRAQLKPNEPSVLHHMTREEILVAVSGEGSVRIGDERHILTPGDAFAIPAFTDFILESTGETTFEAMVVLPVGGRAVVGNDPAFLPPWSL